MSNWEQVTAKPEYQALPPEEQAAAQKQFFDERIAPQVPEEDRDNAWKQFTDKYPPSRTVSAGEAAQREVAGAILRGNAATMMAAGGLVSHISTDAGDKLMAGAQKLRKMAEEKTDIQPNEHVGGAARAAQFAAGIPSGVIEAPITPFNIAQNTLEAGGTPQQAGIATAASLPATVVQMAAPEFGGRIGGKVVEKVLGEAGKKVAPRVIGKAIGGGVAGTIAGPESREIQNLATPDNMPQQSIMPTLEDFAAGVGFGMMAKRVPRSEYVTRLANATSAATKASGFSDPLAGAITKAAARHAIKVGEVKTDMAEHTDAAIDAMSDKDLRKLSPRYDHYRNAGMSEDEVKSSLKGLVRDSFAAVAPKDMAEQDLEEQPPPPPPPAAEPAKPDPYGPTHQEVADLQKLQTDHDSATSPETQRALKEEMKKMQGRIDARRAVGELRAQASEWQAKGNDEQAKSLRDKADELLEKAGLAAPKAEGIEVGTAKPEDVEAAQKAREVPETPVAAEPASPGIAADRSALETMRAQAGIQVGTAPSESITLETPKPQEALPAPGQESGRTPISVTPEGVAFKREPFEEMQPEAHWIGNPPPGAPAPPPLRPEPGVVYAHTPLAGGRLADGRVVIDPRMPQWVWMPEHTYNHRKIPGRWVNAHAEMVRHETKEVGAPVPNPSDNIGQMGYEAAHDKHGNAGTRQHLEVTGGGNPKVYSNVIRPAIENIRKLSAEGQSPRIHPLLDERPYRDSGQMGLLEKNRGTDNHATEPTGRGVQRDGTVPEEKAAAGSSAPTKLQPGDRPAEAAKVEDPVGIRFADWLGQVAKRHEMESAGQEILDGMEEKGISPQSTSEKFWGSTYFRLPAEVQARFRNQLHRVTGYPYGDDLSRVSEWLDMGNDVTNLEGTERGFVALMHEANRRFESEGVSHAAENGNKPEDRQPEHPGAAQRPAVPEDGGKARNGDRSEAGGGNRPAEAAGEQGNRGKPTEVSRDRSTSGTPTSGARGEPDQGGAAKENPQPSPEAGAGETQHEAGTGEGPQTPSLSAGRPNWDDSKRDGIKTVGDLSASLSNSFGRKVTVNEVKAPNAKAQALALTIKRLFGRDVKFINSNDPGVHGAYIGGRTLFIHPDSPHGVANTIGHELLHSLREQSRGAYYKLVTDLHDAIHGDRAQAFKKYLTDLYKQRGYPPLNFDKLHEEMLANIVGDHFTDPKFVRHLQKVLDPNVFRRVAAHALDFYDKLKEKLGVLKNPGAVPSQFLKDADAGRAAVVDALKDISKKSVSPDGETTPALSTGKQPMTVDEASRKYLGVPESELSDAEKRNLADMMRETGALGPDEKLQGSGDEHPMFQASEPERMRDRWAIPTADRKLREQIAAADRDIDTVREGRTRQQNLADAQRRLASDYNGRAAAIRTKLERGDQLDPVETEEATQLKDDAFRRGDMVEAVKLNRLLHGSRSATAAALSQLRDPLESPTERVRRNFTDQLLTPDQATQRRIEQAKSPAEVNKLLEQHAKTIDELRAKIRTLGVDPDSLEGVKGPTDVATQRKLGTSLKKSKELWETHPDKVGVLAGAIRSRLQGGRTSFGDVANDLARNFPGLRDQPALIEQAWERVRGKSPELNLPAAESAKEAIESTPETKMADAQAKADAAVERWAQRHVEAMAMSPADRLSYLQELQAKKDAKANSPEAHAVTEQMQIVKELRRQIHDRDRAILRNATRAQEALRIAKADAWDTAYEWTRSALHTSFVLPAKKIASDAANIMFHYFMERPLAAGLGKLEGRAVPGPIGELKAAFTGMADAWSTGLQHAMSSWREERNTFEDEFGAARAQYTFERGIGPYTGEGFTDYHEPPVIGNPFFKHIRWNIRAVGAIQAMAQTLIARMEVGQHALELGKAKGLEGERLSSFMQSELDNLGSDSWWKAVQASREWTGTSKPTVGPVAAIIRAKNIDPYKAKTPGQYAALRATKEGARYLFPFPTLPFNFFRMGVRMSPLGSIGMLVKLAHSLVQKARGGEWTYHVNDFNQDAARQLLAFGTTVLIASQMTDEDGNPTITGYEPWGEQNDRLPAPPAHSIRLGGEWRDYSAIGPIAHLLGTSVDMLRTGKEIAAGSPVGAASDRFGQSLYEQFSSETFMRGLTDLFSAMNMKDPGWTSNVSKFIANMALEFYPTMFKQMAAATQPAKPEFKGKPADFSGRAAKLLQEGTKLPLPGWQAEPEVDLFGADVRKDSGNVSTTDYINRLVNPFRGAPVVRDDNDDLRQAITHWNTEHPDDQLKFGIPAATYKMRGDQKSRTMTQQQYHDFLQQTGERVAQRLHALPIDWSKPDGLTDHDKARIEAAIKQTHTTERMRFTHRLAIEQRLAETEPEDDSNE